MTTNLPWKTAWVAGAETDLGREIARALAAAGVKAAISGTGLGPAADLEAAGVKVFAHDVSPNGIAAAAAALSAHLGAIDLAVFAPPAVAAMDAASYDGAKAMAAMDASYAQVLRGLGAVMPGMIKRGAGHIALVSSMSGYRGFTGTAAGAPAQAALISLSEALKNDLARFGVKISIINPAPQSGSRDAASSEPALSAREAAAGIISGLQRGRYEIAYPSRTLWRMKSLRMIPNSLFFWLQRRRESSLG